MYLKARVTPASAPGGHTWEDEDSVVKVPDELGHELAKITHQFQEVLPGDPDHPGGLEPPLEPRDDLDPGPGEGRDELEPEQENEEQLEPSDEDEDLIGEAPYTPKPCGREGCGNFAKRGEDFCRHHIPK